MPNYKIFPQNEPDGEGNGWADCDEQNATAFAVWDMDMRDGPDGLVELCDTRSSAERWIAREQTEETTARGKERGEWKHEALEAMKLKR